jgi:hypothetical protein
MFIASMHHHVQEGGGDVGCGIHQADDPLVAVGIGSASRVVDTERNREREVGAVGPSLIPASASSLVIAIEKGWGGLTGRRRRWNTGLQ